MIRMHFYGIKNVIQITNLKKMHAYLFNFLDISENIDNRKRKDRRHVFLKPL